MTTETIDETPGETKSAMTRPHLPHQKRAARAHVEGTHLGLSQAPTFLRPNHRDEVTHSVTGALETAITTTRMMNILAEATAGAKTAVT